MTEREILGKLNRAVDGVTPDNFSEILEKCPAGKVVADNTFSYYRQRRIRRKNTLRGLAVMAAMLCLVVGIGTGQYYQKGSTTVSLDVNPSVTMEVNRLEKVVQVQALNQQGNQIIGSMDLEGSDVEVAVNALIGAMVREGYLTEATNSVLLSVVDSDSRKGEQLEQRLISSTKNAFGDSGIDGAILSQNMKDFKGEYEGLMREYNISAGKAALAYQIASQSTRMEPGDIATMGINDINLLATSQGFTLGGISAVGTASSHNYIGEEKARELAFAYCKRSPEEVHHMQVTMDYNEGIVTYEVEFYLDDNKYEYELDAQTGEVIEWENEWKRQELLEKELRTIEREQEITGIGKNKALEIALEDVGISNADIIFQEITPEYENGVECYDVDFHTEDMSYEYKIDASTGEILQYIHDRVAY